MPDLNLGSRTMSVDHASPLGDSTVSRSPGSILGEIIPEGQNDRVATFTRESALAFHRSAVMMDTASGRRYPPPVRDNFVVGENASSIRMSGENIVVIGPSSPDQVYRHSNTLYLNVRGENGNVREYRTAINRFEASELISILSRALETRPFIQNDPNDPFGPLPPQPNHGVRQAYVRPDHMGRPQFTYDEYPSESINLTPNQPTNNEEEDEYF